MIPQDFATIATSLSVILVPVAETLMPVLMLAAARPRREPFPLRAAVVFGIVAAVTLVVSPLAYFVIMNSANPDG